MATATNNGVPVTEADRESVFLTPLLNAQYGTPDAPSSTTEFLYVKALCGGTGGTYTYRASVTFHDDGSGRRPTKTKARPGPLECLLHSLEHLLAMPYAANVPPDHVRLPAIAYLRTRCAGGTEAAAAAAAAAVAEGGAVAEGAVAEGAVAATAVAEAVARAAVLTLLRW